ncbi:DUF4232 domain-containing protein [Streptomyces sp. NRRL S-340]|uniref:DUF4232 domain-containing protein n=1 Tax=Streptomyces sp. NRRL S-340 TaxID=1463901 RepID=UPI00055A3C39|nr:DUF4232 domain-containing protein [Streptomyces sp. NRRL S-340]
MRIRTAVALSAAPAAVAVLLLSAPPGQAASARAAARPAAPACAGSRLTVRAQAVPADRTVVRVQVTNHGRACAVDRVPTVTFGDLDGAAQPVPPGGSGPYRLDAGRTAYAAVRTVAHPADPEVRRVDSLTVWTDPSGPGRVFTAAELGAGGSVRVWEPVTTWWQPSAAAADRAIGLSR